MKIKKKVSRFILSILGKGLCKLSFLDEYIMSEIEIYEEGMIIQIIILPTGDNIKLKKQNDGFILLKKSNTEKADLVISFKNVSSAFNILTGKSSIHQAYCENRLIVQGDIHLAMPLVRVLYRVEAYLFPKLISKNILKSKPKLTVNRLRVYALLLG